MPRGQILLTRVNFNLPTALVERVKEYGKELGLPLTHVYTMLINQALDYQHIVKNLPQLLETVNKIKDFKE